MARAKRAAAGLSKLSLQDLRTEMLRRRKTINVLQKKRSVLAAKVEKIDAEINEFESVFGGSAAAQAGPGRRHASGKRVGRPRGTGKAVSGRGRQAVATGAEGAKPGTLAGALHALLKGKTMRVKDAVVGVRQAGYKTDAANLRTMVNQALSKHTNLFQKKGRGKYTSK